MSEPRPRLCVVEDDPIMGESLCVRFDLEGFDVDWHRRAGDAWHAIESMPYHVVLCDIRLPDFGGDELFGRLRAGAVPPPPFVFITGYGSIDRAVALLKQGATDYITKPFDIEALVDKVRKLALARAPASQTGECALGVSAAMRRIAQVLPQIAARADTLLVTGESGVGKERVAQEYDRLARATAACPFIAVNCGAIPEGLIESELFGHEKGAFTGAVRMRRGCFEQADCGTLFLDEIGEMPLAMQVKLLRAIQERRFRRVGGEQSFAVKLRLVCATNRDLRERIAEGSFREDLFYRINVVNLRIPALRERREDIPWFTRIFLDEFARIHGGERRALDPHAEQALLEYPWPGNVRELKHTIERACILSPNAVLMPGDLFEPVAAAASAAAARNLDEYLHDCERAYIRKALDDNAWHMGNTAQLLGISRKSLWEKMKRLGIQARGAA